METLRQELTSLAEEGNKEINNIKNSKEPEEIKVTQIVATIHQYRALANLAAAKYGENVLDAVQSIMDAQGKGQSAREFAQTHGLNMSQMYRQPDDQQELTNQVRGMLDKPGSTMGIANEPQMLASPPAESPVVPGSGMGVAAEPQIPAQSSPVTTSAVSPRASGSTMGVMNQPQIAAGLNPGKAPAPATPPAAGIPAAPAMPAATVPTTSASAPSMPSTGMPSLPGNPATPLSGAPLARRPVRLKA